MGPIVSGMAATDRPDTVCAICPKAMRYRSGQHGMQAFCRELRHISWQSGEQDPVTEYVVQFAASDSS